MKLISFLLLATSSAIFAADVKLTWDPSETPDVEYVLYRGEERIPLGEATDYTVSVEVKTSFYLTALDTESGLESEPSNTVIWYPRPKPPGTLRLELVVDVPDPADAAAVQDLVNKVKAALKEEK